MSFTSSMMFISALLTLLLYVDTGCSQAAPRVSRYDASPISRKPGSAADTWDTFLTDMPPPPALPGNRPPGVGPVAGLAAASPGPSILQPHSGLTSAAISRLSAARKRSAVSVVSQRSVNDAWAADHTGDPENSQESSCNCTSGAEGILDPDECDQSSGQCRCVSGYTGLQCEECEDGFFTNGTSGCLPCSCDSFGAINPLCDSSGTCVCKTGVDGPKCDECHPGFFHFSNTGCRPCQCHNHTSSCHPQSGVCLNCEGNTHGSNCDLCQLAFSRRAGASLTEACSPCPCSNVTSTSTCHTDSSGSQVCDQCLPAYSGSQCNECSAGFYRSSGSCVPCDCSGNADPRGPAQLCHPDTGHCLRCINSTTGNQCQLCAAGYTGDAHAQNCTLLAPRILPTAAGTTTSAVSSLSTTSSSLTSSTASTPSSSSSSSSSSSAATSTSTSTSTAQVLLTSLSSPTDNTTAALTQVSWTQFNVIILAVIILVVVVLLGFVGGVYTYREYQNRKLNAPFWTIELKEDNISFSSYHDSIPNADVSGLLEDEANEVAPNGQLALTTQNNCYKV
ncbi:multiple epidermal growth factor-like domains protein 9 [Solea solea]|uniref:multiple epidermal growth factor-like domains protein 9 n=1 Tax=Solea solea TaxID=90069 RepID=UPI00272CBC42|nr:multiple epidermal growth factor-like domains protein 9 [Solea solea]